MSNCCNKKNTAKCAVYAGVKTPFEIREYPVSEPPAGYVGLDLVASGVCGTDVHMYEGRLGAKVGNIIGHEFVGKVREINCDTDVKVGDNVIVEIAVPCGECLLCKTGDGANCTNMGVTNGNPADLAPHFWGGFTEYSYAPAANIVKLPEGVDPIAASVFACPGPTVIHGFELAKRGGVNIADVKKAAVQGLGPVGMFALIYLKAMGVKEIVCLTYEYDEARFALAKELGATTVLDYQTRTDEINSLAGDFDLVFEASGSPKAVPTGMNLLRNRGTYIVPGQYSASGGIEIQPQLITFKAMRIFGSSQYDYADVVTYANFLDNNRDIIPTIRRLATTYTVEDINTAFADAIARKNVKTVLVK